MNRTPFDLLEFHKVLTAVSGFSKSDATRRSVLEILPLTSVEEITSKQELIREIMKMSHEGAPLGLTHFPDVSHLIMKARPEGAVLEANELSGFIPVLEIASDISLQIREREDLPSLREVTAGLTGFPEILRTLKRSFDSEGNILDTASTLLSSLRDQVRRLEVRIRKKLEEMVRDESLAVFLQDDFITKRSGRWVIPVRMDSKGQVAGVVHDVSKSGETAFIEPLSIINLANELENLVAEQRAEEIRILRSISSKIREASEGIEGEYQTIVTLDLLHSIAAFADSMEMQIPSINEEGTISLAQARHPLLSLAFTKAERKQKVVPLDLRLSEDAKVMVITGSNAGGKTIALKTVGLLVVMALSGMPVPADSSSSIPLVKSLLVDIGDEQSIESSLSTFSAHVSNISDILRRADHEALVLIDELGTGTDPDEGAALACAVLKELKEDGALVFATTHLADIKGFVHRTEGMLNASMEFDRKTLTPLYRLRIGEPGGSHALETARRFGLPDHIIDSARAMLGGIKTEFDNLIEDLNEKRARYEQGLEEIRRLKNAIAAEKRTLEERLQQAEKGHKEMLSKAFTEASEIVLDTRKRMQNLLEEIKKKERAERSEVRESIKKVEAEARRISEKLRDYDAGDAAPLPIDKIEKGEVVFVRSLGYDAPVIEINKKSGRLKVRAGGMEIELPASDVAAGRGIRPEAGREKGKQSEGDETASSRINLVGLRVDEALSRLEPFLNHASLAGLAEVTIIHGFGAGILMRAVREHLDGHPLVKKFRKGEKEEGGGGVTVATMA